MNKAVSLILLILNKRSDAKDFRELVLSNSFLLFIMLWKIQPKTNSGGSFQREATHLCHLSCGYPWAADYYLNSGVKSGSRSGRKFNKR